MDKRGAKGYWISTSRIINQDLFDEYKEFSKLRKVATENSTFTIMEGLDEAAKLRRAMGL